MARSTWRYDPTTRLVTAVIPPSVEMCCSLDDSGMLAAYTNAYGMARWDNGKMICSPRALVEIVTTTAHLAADHMAEGERSSGGALRWAYRMQKELRAAGWARPGRFGYEATEAAHS